jgi:hypothetical protein
VRHDSSSRRTRKSRVHGKLNAGIEPLARPRRDTRVRLSSISRCRNCSGRNGQVTDRRSTRSGTRGHELFHALSRRLNEPWREPSSSPLWRVALRPGLPTASSGS